jgi:hypothetical protein
MLLSGDGDEGERDEQLAVRPAGVLRTGAGETLVVADSRYFSGSIPATKVGDRACPK